jgi:hypothetical protein
MDNIPIICLIGSSRFRRSFVEEGHRLETTGHLVLCMTFFQHSDNIDVSPEHREILRKVDRKRIDLSDEVRVLNVGGYIGEDTRKEIEYAESCGKKISYLKGNP